MKKEQVEDSPSSLSQEECSCRIAAAEYDMSKIAGHAKDGLHPNLMEI